jgi:hypothetical protein
MKQQSSSFLEMEEELLSSSRGSPTTVTAAASLFTYEQPLALENLYSSLPTTSNTNETPIKHPKKKQRKMVRFDSHVTEWIYRQKSPSKSERKLLWYSAKEIRATRTKICALNLSASTGKGAALMEDFALRDSWRGLEHVRQGSLLLKLEHRQNFVKAFLYFHIELGVYDADALGVFSSTNSQLDRQRALDFGTQDAVDACKIYYDFLKSSKTSNKSNRSFSSKKKTSSSDHSKRVRERRPSHTSRGGEMKHSPQVCNLTLSL